MFYDEWRVLMIGTTEPEIELLAIFKTREKALVALAQDDTPAKGANCFLTVEGRRVYDGMYALPKYSQTGVCKGIVTELTSHWKIDHLNKWYRSTQEPGYSPDNPYTRQALIDAGEM